MITDKQYIENCKLKVWGFLNGTGAVGQTAVQDVLEHYGIAIPAELLGYMDAFATLAFSINSNPNDLKRLQELAGNYLKTSPIASQLRERLDAEGVGSVDSD